MQDLSFKVYDYFQNEDEKYNKIFLDAFTNAE
jgi:hypothetical protein